MLPAMDASSSRTPDASRKMQTYREKLRRQGLRPVQVWVPDAQRPAFKRKLAKQVAALSTRRETDALKFIEQVFDDS